MTLQIKVKLLVAVVKTCKSKLGLSTTLHLAKSSHEWRDLAVVCRVYVSARMHQKLDHIKMTAICRKPERSVSFFVSYVYVGTPAERKKGVKPRVDLYLLVRSAALKLTY